MIAYFKAFGILSAALLLWACIWLFVASMSTPAKATTTGFEGVWIIAQAPTTTPTHDCGRWFKCDSHAFNLGQAPDCCAQWSAWRTACAKTPTPIPQGG